MQLEAVGRISVSDLCLQIGRQIDNVDSIEWALFRADTAANAEALRNECDLRTVLDFDTELAGPYDGA